MMGNLEKDIVYHNIIQNYRDIEELKKNKTSIEDVNELIKRQSDDLETKYESYAANEIEKFKKKISKTLITTIVVLVVIAIVAILLTNYNKVIDIYNDLSKPKQLTSQMRITKGTVLYCKTSHKYFNRQASKTVEIDGYVSDNRFFFYYDQNTLCSTKPIK